MGIPTLKLALACLFLLSAAYAVDISSCQNLSGAGETYALNQSVNISSATCFNVTAQNVTLDCAGYSIRGTNTTSTYSIYSNQFNTTIRNCNISNFQHGIYFRGATNGTMENTNVSTTRAGYGIFLNDGASYNRITGINAAATAANGYGIFIYSISNNNTLANITASAAGTSGTGIYLYTSAYNSLSNITAASAGSSGSAITLYNSSNFNTLSGINASATGLSCNAVTLSTNSNFNTLSGIAAATITGAAISISGFNNTLSGINATATNTTDEYGDPISGTAIYITGSNHSLSSINATATTGYAIRIFSSTGNTLSNLSAAASGVYASTVYLSSGSDNNTISNLTALTGNAGSPAIFISQSSNNTLTCINATSTAATYAIRIAFGSNSTLISNSTATAYGSTVLAILSGSSSSTVVNTTLVSAGEDSILLDISSDSGANTVCLNNFTNTSDYFVQDANGSNSYNCTYDGKNQGNIWWNVMNGSVSITSVATPSSFPSLYIGTNGTGYPYNSTNAQGKLSGSITDFAPLTSQAPLACSGLSAAGTTYTLTANASITGATCFNVTAQNVTLDCAGYSIIGNNSSNTYGIYSDQFNTTIRNCNISNFATGIYFNGTDNGTIDSTNASSTSSGGYGIYLDSGSNYNQITNINATGAYAFAIGDSSNNNVSNINATGGSGNGFAIWGGSSNNTISNIVASCSGGDAFSISGSCISNNFSNISAHTTDYLPIYIGGTTSQNNLVDINVTSTNNNVLYVGSGISNYTFSRINAIGAYGIYFDSPSISNITLSDINVTATGSGAHGISLRGTNYNISGVTSIATGSNGHAFFFSSSSNNTLSSINATATGPGGIAVYFSSSSNNTLSGVNATSNSSNGINLSNSNLNTIANSTITSNSGIPLYFENSNSSLFYNNTFVATDMANTLLYLDSSSNSNTFCWNNFTATSGLYANDTNGTNTWNASACAGEGNIWWNVMNGSVSVTGTNNSTGFPSLYVGTAGSGYPYNNSTAQSKVFGNVTDYAPLTPTVTPSPPATATPPTGGSGYTAPLLSYSFNCSSGALAITAKSGGSPISGLAVRLKDPAQIGWLASAATNSSGTATFAITESKRYSAETVLASGYSTAYLPPFTLTLCNAAQPLANQTTPAQSTCSSFTPETCPSECVVCPPCEVCSSISCQTEEFCSSMGFSRTWYESVKPKNQTQPTQDDLEKQASDEIASAKAALEQARSLGKDTRAASSALSLAILEYDAGNYAKALELARKANGLLAQAKPPAQATGTGQDQAIPQNVQETTAPALSLAVIGGGVLIVLAGIAAYIFLARRKKRRR